MKKWFRTTVEDILYSASLDLSFIPKVPDLYEKTYRCVRPYTMTSRRRIYELLDAIQYISKSGLPGDFVECGVWKGGSSLAAAMMLKSLGETGRDLWLFDTYEGMVAPGDKDGSKANAGYKSSLRGGQGSDWCRSSLEEVKSHMFIADYPDDKIHYVAGAVEKTLPAQGPEKICLLRLDTDWYESTRHELETLYPRLVPGGILIIDDYGYWEGARRAVDEYFEDQNIHVYIKRIDETGVVIVKPRILDENSKS